MQVFGEISQQKNAEDLIYSILWHPRNVVYLDNSLSKLIIRMWIHHCSTWPLNVCSFSRCLTQSHGTKRAHSWAWRSPIANWSLSPWHLRQTNFILQKLRLKLLHIERCQVKPLIGRKTPHIPVITIYQLITSLWFPTQKCNHHFPFYPPQAKLYMYVCHNTKDTKWKKVENKHLSSISQIKRWKQKKGERERER